MIKRPLVILGADEQGENEPLAILEGYRELRKSWAEVLRDLKIGGLIDLKLFYGDGALGLWSVINVVYPQARQQSCRVHKMCNVLVHFPKRLHGEVRRCLLQKHEARRKAASRALLTFFSYPRGALTELEDD